MIIKKWFYDKRFTKTEKNAIENGSGFITAGEDYDIVKTTDKAIQFKITTDFGIIYKWIPISCLEENIIKQIKGSKNEKE